MDHSALSAGLTLGALGRGVQSRLTLLTSRVTIGIRDSLVSLAGDREGLARGTVEETANGYPAGRPKETTNAEQRTNPARPAGAAEQ